MPNTNRPRIINLATGQDITNAVEASPLVARGVDFEYGGYQYWLAYIPQKVKDTAVSAIEEAELHAALSVNALPEVRNYMKEHGLKDLAGIKNSEIVKLLPPEKAAGFILGNKSEAKKLRVEAYALSISEWNVPDLNGNDLPHGDDEFTNEGGVYDAALEAVEADFLKFSKRTQEETEKKEVSVTDGDTLSTAPEKISQTEVSDTSPDGPLISDSSKSSLESQAERV
jgi:hypothetical protein